MEEADVTRSTRISLGEPESPVITILLNRFLLVLKNAERSYVIPVRRDKSSLSYELAALTVRSHTRMVQRSSANGTIKVPERIEVGFRHFLEVSIERRYIGFYLTVFEGTLSNGYKPEKAECSQIVFSLYQPVRIDMRGRVKIIHLLGLLNELAMKRNSEAVARIKDTLD